MNSANPVFVSLAQVMRAHRTSIELHGGIDGVRDQGAVESALASAMNTWNYGGDAFDVAAAYAFHLAESQAFLDGNKRTAITTALAFLALNGFYAKPNQDELYDAMIAIARREMDKPGLAAVLRAQFPRR